MPPSPSLSRGSSPDESSATEPGEQDRAAALARCDVVAAANKERSPFLRLPIDIFRCVMDHLDRDAAWALKRTCRGLSKSVLVDELVYRYPIQQPEVREIRLNEWKYRSGGENKWRLFQDSITDSNRHYVYKLAMSHWCSIEDFKWIQENLPNLKALDITAIKDFTWTPEETWTWNMLAKACPALFGRLEELEVANWADYTAHSHIECSYSYNDYRFKLKFRLSRRRDGGSIAKMIFPLCTQLKTLAIREGHSGFRSWNEFEVHRRVCCLVDGITDYCPPTLEKLRVHDYAPYRALLSTDITRWSNLKSIEIDLFSWMEERQERDVLGPIPHRISAGTHHRDEEEEFDDDECDDCDRNHLQIGNHVVQNASASFDHLLQNLRTTMDNFPHINFLPLQTSRDKVLHPFHLVKVTSRFRPTVVPPLPIVALLPPLNGNANVNLPQIGQPPVFPSARTDPVANANIQHSLRWLAEKCHWKPVFAWKSMMCDVFPSNLEINQFLLPKAEILTRIQTMVETLRSLNIPVRLSIAKHQNTIGLSGLDGSLYFGDYKVHVGEGEDRQELLAPTQARFNLSGIAHLVDELSIQYASDVPGVAGWGRPSERRRQKELQLFEREKKGWRRFWKRYALRFTNLKKLSASVPTEIFDDWGTCAELRTLFDDNRWSVLHIKNDPAAEHMFGPWLLGSNFRFNITKKRSRIKFVHNVIFREDTKPLSILGQTGTAEENEDRTISDEEIAVGVEGIDHQFWPLKTVNAAKRKAEDDVVGDKGREKFRKNCSHSTFELDMLEI
ncbi:hypothetical protein P154DRAFT_527788 [Amniculicola lignicola CBS 123094]|uniref:F-box domain-containing protein n=1 Tax=Amniculicola lignicola CBS 123094 TaxID=1392246 RepID=A0A6A5VZR2_9PLEO|nr:hypothetical protein P154DRAFT_527788 [Amniculicola lignicola CBS 123094]